MERNKIVKARYTNKIDSHNYSELRYSFADGQEYIMNFCAYFPMPKVEKIIGLTEEELQAMCLGMRCVAIGEYVKLK